MTKPTLNTAATTTHSTIPAPPYTHTHPVSHTNSSLNATPPAVLAALVGQPVQAIDTPALVLDLDAMERNLARMSEFARTHQLRWRPHAKMHKSAALAQQQIAAGAVGVCVQKTAEAQALADAGVNNLYISNQVIAPHKLARVAVLAQTLAQRGGRLAIAVDSMEGIERLAQACAALTQPSHTTPDALTSATGLIDVLVEIDVGHARCGAAPERAGTLAQAIASHTSLRFAGLQAYQGRAQHLRSVDERRAAIDAAAQAVHQARKAIESRGLSVPLVSGAGTGTYPLETASGLWHELQVGSFLFLDADYARNQTDPKQIAFDHALFVKTQIISTAAHQVVCDAGHKSHAIDSGMPLVLNQAGQAALTYSSGGDEHGILRLSQADAPLSKLPRLGDCLWLIPGHCDPTVNLHDYYIGVRGGLQTGIVERIIRIDARGALT